jgi:DNA mismatch repair ATPase MutL
LTLDDKSRNTRPPQPTRTLTDTSSRQENIPPRGPPMHRPTRSQEQAMRQRTGPPSSSRPRRPTAEPDIFADSAAPRKSTERRHRRNSDSSLMERKPLDPEEEKKRQERRRQERRQREGDASKDPKVKKPSRKLDIIDQLDATSIYGTGRKYSALVFDICISDLHSIPPRWTIRCLQSSPQQERQQTCTYAGVSKGFSEQCTRRRGTVE